MYTLRFLEISDAEQLLDYHRRNHEFHRDWSPIPPMDFFTLGFHRRQLEQTVAMREREEEFRFGIFTREPERLVGRINLVSIERRAFQNGRFGYSIDALHRNSGIMTRMLRSVLGFAFDYVRLHRVEANIMPGNSASRRVLEKCGFHKIGYSPRMLYINGQWEDHEMYMMLADEFKHALDESLGRELEAFLPMVKRG